MWKWKKKQQIDEAAEEETLSSKEEEGVNVETEASSSSEEEAASTATEETASTTKGVEKAGITAEEAPSVEAQKESGVKEALPEKRDEVTGAGMEESPPVAEVPSSGVFIFGKKVESRFKKFLTAMFSIFLLPPAIVFALAIITAVVLIAFPLISIVLPIVLLSLSILFILLPVVLPFLTVVSLITGKGKVQFGLENKKFAIKVLGITFPPYAGR